MGFLGTGRGPGEPVGWYQAFVNVYLPAGARVLDVRGGVLDLEEKEGGRPVVMGLIGADPGGSATLHVHYRVDGIVVPDGDARLFALDVLPQPALRPDAVHVVVELPAGVHVLGSSEGTTVDGGALRWEGVPATLRHLWVRFA